MNELRRGEIIYEEGRRGSSAKAEAPEAEQLPVDEVPADKRDNGSEGSRPLLITVQLVLCLIAALALFLLKAADSDIYRDFIDFYRSELSKPIVSREAFDSAGVERLIEGGVQVKVSTPDEAADS